MILLFPYCMIDARLDRIQGQSAKKAKKAFLILHVQKSKQVHVHQNFEILKIQNPLSILNYLFEVSDFVSEFISTVQIKKFFRYSSLPPPSQV